MASTTALTGVDESGRRGTPCRTSYPLGVLAATDDGLVDLAEGEVLDPRAARFVDHEGRALLSDGTLLDVERRELARVPGATCFAVTTDGAWIVGTEEASLFVVRGGEVARVEAFERAPTREGWHTPWGGPPAVRSVAVTAERWFVSVHVGGVLISDDGGRSFRDAIDLEVDVHQVVVDPDGGAWLANGMGGLAYAADGVAYEEITEGLHATYARAVAVSGDRVYLSVSTGPGGGQSGVYRARRDERRLERCPTPELGANVDTHCLVARGADVFAATRDAVLHSSDEGARWSRLDARVRGVRALGGA